ncbi:3-dehydroquinate synthase [Leucothrix arctica]|uniref:3-dehydroquinate synthase n=1 Tax=Leucothrix arctica TaxID=1481894 RepID=A0A317CJL3_9GAMM|nr:3-dehydroquinate synthase [Leucothrix arctica]PWQ98529.1 3-dehydroquinate synthase [Leucothrix arctica]
MQKLTVELGDRSYPIYIGAGLLKRTDLLPDFIKGKSVITVSNETVAPLYAETLNKSLEGFKASSVELPDGEVYKTLTVLDQIFTGMLENHCDRQTTLVALGGGVVGDMGGFAAASYQRGINFIQVPTTLLSMVDSSVGGKTGVNHPLGKNMIGAFHQPQCVVIDTETLDTLSDRELSAGIAEVLKYGFINDLKFLEWLEENMSLLLARDPEALAYAIYISCKHKAATVAADEREAGQRALLNLGHTFGHAIETGMGYGNWLHGEGVAAGTVMAAELSMKMGWISEADLSYVKHLFTLAKLPIEPPSELTADDYRLHMMRDKKTKDGVMNLILMHKLGECIQTSDYDAQAFQEVLERV